MDFDETASYSFGMIFFCVCDESETFESCEAFFFQSLCDLFFGADFFCLVPISSFCIADSSSSS